MKPTVQSILLADRVYQDISGKYIIVGVFDVHAFMLNKPQAEPETKETGPIRRTFLEIQNTGNPWAFMSLTDVKGTVRLELRFESLTNGEVYFSTEFSIASEDPLASIQITLPVPKLPNIVGCYVLDLLYEQTSIGSHRLKVIELP